MTHQAHNYCAVALVALITLARVLSAINEPVNHSVNQ